MFKKILLVLLWSTSAMATTHYVDLASPSPTPPYTNWTTAAISVQDAVDAAPSNNATVLVTSGHYYLSSEITVNKDITIQSINGPDTTIIDAQWFSRCFYLDDSECIIEGFSIIKGHSPSEGGGIYCSSSAPLITDCLIEDCASNTQGGGVYKGTLKHCRIRYNTAISRGGGLSGSIAKGCVVTDNYSGSYGGGMYSCTAYGCTVTYNTSDGYGGGVSGSGSTYNGIHSMELYNSVVWYNLGQSGDDISKTTSAFSCSPDLNNGVMGNIITEPHFIDGTNGNYRLMSGSPCLDTGLNPYAQTTSDFDGNPRFVYGQADIGAYEYQTQESAINLPIRVNLEFSSDLSTWINTEKSVEWLVPANDSIGFYRARSEL